MQAKRMFIPAYVRGTEFDPEQREFPFVITTNKVDGHRTIFETNGWDFSRYLKNPVVFYNHRSGGDDPDDLIGITVDGPNREDFADGSSGYVATVRFEPADVNPKAEKIRKKIIAGTIRMASIGADVHQWEWRELPDGGEILVFTRQELLEWSVVNVGSNPAALVKKNADVINQIRAARQEEKQPDQPEPVDQNNGLNDVQVARLEIAKIKQKVQ